MNPIVLPLPGNEDLARSLAVHLKGDRGTVGVARFPDGECCVRIESPVFLRDAVVVATLDRPDEKFLPLAFLAATAREQGANRVGLVAPYLAYLRQDRRFRPGEGVSAIPFARLLSGTFDWLVTVDPHLHRIRSLGSLYTIPARAVHAARLIGPWIARHVERPLLVGPDEESEQWASQVAESAGAPYVVLEKVRRGPRSVAIGLPDLSGLRDRTPVLVDDIISTAQTMIETIRRLRSQGLPAPVCIAVHAVFAEGAYEALLEAAPARIVTTNTIRHPTNAIDVTDLLLPAVESFAPAGTAVGNG